MEEHIRKEPYKKLFYATLAIAIFLGILFVGANYIIIDQSNAYQDLSKDNDLQVKTIYEQDNNIKDKDKRINELESKNRDLQKKLDSQPKWRANSQTDITNIHTKYSQLSSYVFKHNINLDADKFYNYGVSYGIDPSFALATWILETGWGYSPLWIKSHNPAGIKCGTQYCTYNTSEDGIEAMYRLLNLYTKGTIDYVGKRTTVADIRAAWSEVDDVSEILDIMKNIASWKAVFEFKIICLYEWCNGTFGSKRRHLSYRSFHSTKK